MDFNTAVDLLLAPNVEGGYVNNSNDPGGETKWGITRRTAFKHGYDGDMRIFPKETAKQIYHDEYWAPQRIDELPDLIRYCVFDGCVNEGVERTVGFLHEALGLVDGPVDSATTVAAGVADATSLLANLLAQRVRHYTSLGTWGMFGRGWANRIATNLEIVVNLLAPKG